MIREVKIVEWRPDECHTRIGDVVKSETGLVLLKVKCRRCSKDEGADIFHYIKLDGSDIMFSGRPLGVE